MRLDFDIRPSRFLDVLLMSAHGVALAVLLPLDMPMWLKAVLALAVLASAGLYLYGALSSPVKALALDGDHVVLTRRGRHTEGRLLNDSFVTPYLAVLNFQPEGARYTRSIVIMPDSLDAEAFRQLRVYLKWGVPPE